MGKVKMAWSVRKGILTSDSCTSHFPPHLLCAHKVCTFAMDMYQWLFFHLDVYGTNARRLLVSHQLCQGGCFVCLRFEHNATNTSELLTVHMLPGGDMLRQSRLSQ